MIRTCAITDIHRCVDFAWRMNNNPETSSGYCSKAYSSIMSDFEIMLRNETHILVGSFDGEVIKTLLGFYVDQEKSSADCIGPFLECGNEFEEGKAVFQFGQSMLGAIKKFNFFFSHRNKMCVELMKVLQAVDNGNECTLVLEKERFVEQHQKEPILPLSRDFDAQFRKMHQSIFPEVYVSGSDILHSIGTEREVLCAVHQKTLVGYIVLKRKKDPSEMAVEILAVDSPFRGQGYGKALLRAGLQRIFETPSVERAWLVVENINSTAKNLYTSFGFVTHAEYHSYQVVYNNG